MSTITETQTTTSLSLNGTAASAKQAVNGTATALITHREPLKSAGSLDKFEKFDVTSVIGTEFNKDVQLKDLLRAENSDELIRDLAILISQRGVVFFRNQDIDIESQKILGQKLGELSGKPATSKLHVHPLTEETSELGDEVTIISSDRRGEYYNEKDDRPTISSTGWHSDITFEKVPSDYAILKIHTLPKTGGDTLWASAYDAYDRLSPQFANFLETLTARHEAHHFKVVAQRLGNKERTGNRGAPENFGDDYEAIHPVIRTNPVTGWKGLFVNYNFVKRINGVSRDESDNLIKYLNRHVAEHHAGQVRFRWNKNDVAIWDNRSVFHTATWDYKDRRVGDRVVSLGEKPYFDPESKSRSEVLGLKNGRTYP